jgi:hypothetical protein
MLYAEILGIFGAILLVSVSPIYRSVMVELQLYVENDLYQHIHSLTIIIIFCLITISRGHRLSVIFGYRFITHTALET